MLLFGSTVIFLFVRSCVIVWRCCNNSCCSIIVVHFSLNLHFPSIYNRYAAPGTLLPLCIMTSGDTNSKTIQLLKDNDYFGLQPSQVTIVQQGMGVPALMDNEAKIAVDGDGDVILKPHGHGE